MCFACRNQDLYLDDDNVDVYLLDQTTHEPNFVRCIDNDREQDPCFACECFYLMSLMWASLARRVTNVLTAKCSST